MHRQTATKKATADYDRIVISVTEFHESDNPHMMQHA